MKRDGWSRPREREREDRGRDRKGKRQEIGPDLTSLPLLL